MSDCTYNSILLEISLIECPTGQRIASFHVNKLNFEQHLKCCGGKFITETFECKFNDLGYYARNSNMYLEKLSLEIST